MTQIYSYFAEDSHSNTYLLVDCESGEAAVIDPSHLPSVFDVSMSDIKLKYILLTHGHFDHIGKSEKYRRMGAQLCIHEQDASLLSDGERNASALFMHEPMIIGDADILLHDSAVLTLGNTEIKVLHTPGHTPGCICLMGEDVLFAGDTLFYDSIGRVDFPGSDVPSMITSLRRLMALPADLRVYSGHGPETTIGREVARNPYLQRI